MNTPEYAFGGRESASALEDGHASATVNETNVTHTIAVQDLVEFALDSHGGYDRWKQFSKVTARVVTGGFLWGMKGFAADETPRRMTSEFGRQWIRMEPFGDPNWHMTYQPDEVVIQSQTGETIAEQVNLRDTFAGHSWTTQWTPLQLAYFSGYAMWNYFNLPFLLGEPGFGLNEISPIEQDGQLLRGMKVHFPRSIHTHSSEQNLYFDETGLLRRQDYQVDVAGRNKAGHLISDYIDVEGLKFPTKRRVFVRNEDGTLQLDSMPVSIDLSDFELS